MYPVQSSGAAAVTPFGSAASADSYSASGPELLGRISRDMSLFNDLRSSLLYAASATGGVAVNRIAEAFNHITADASGYYTLHFHPPPSEDDGEWHPILVTATLPSLQLSGPRLYLAPLASSEVTGTPQVVTTAMMSAVEAVDMQVQARAWFFPDLRRSVSTLPLAADITWSSSATPPQPGSTVVIYAKLRNESMNAEIGKWRDRKVWTTTPDGRSLSHWQDETTIYPGSYTLRIVAFDSVSHKVGSTTYSFLVHSVEGQTFATSAIVLTRGCIDKGSPKSTRPRLLDPIHWNGCELELSTTPTFRSSDKFTYLMRVYPSS